jgi:predicted N-acetyltransferase YhbS
MTLTRPAHEAPIGAGVTLRQATRGDHGRIRTLLRAAYGPYARALPDAVFDPYLADLLDLSTHERNGTLIVAEAEGAIIGFVAFYHDIDVQCMGWPTGWAGGRGLAVHPSARVLGVAQALIAACERLAREEKTSVFAFHTASFMTEAARLYDHLGYQRAPEYDQDMAEHYGIYGIAPIPSIAYMRTLPYEPPPSPVAGCRGLEQPCA